jgi:hypothetical protein
VPAIPVPTISPGEDIEFCAFGIRGEPKHTVAGDCRQQRTDNKKGQHEIQHAGETALPQWLRWIIDGDAVLREIDQREIAAEG